MANVEQVNPDDLVLVSDSGDIFVVSMQTTANGTHEPMSVGPLDPALQTVPSTLRDQGVAFAVMPNFADGIGGGVTCYLLNLQDVVGALHPAPSAMAELLMRVAVALRAGSTVVIKPVTGKEETLSLKGARK